MFGPIRLHDATDVAAALREVRIRLHAVMDTVPITRSVVFEVERCLERLEIAVLDHTWIPDPDPDVDDGAVV